MWRDLGKKYSITKKKLLLNLPFLRTNKLDPTMHLYLMPIAARASVRCEYGKKKETYG
jgi:hypothetical protein